MNTFTYSVVVAGAGAGGICAALQAARQGARALLIERAPKIGGTGVHSPVGLVCKFHRGDTYDPINLGLHKELFGKAYAWSGRFGHDDLVPTYDHEELAATYERLVNAEGNLEVRTNTSVTGVRQEPAGDRQRITAVELDDDSVIQAPVFIDSTADGNLAALANAPFRKGRPEDGKKQAATLTFALTDLDHDKLTNPRITTWGGCKTLRSELSALYKDAKAAGETDNPKNHITCFSYPDGKTLLFNCNEVPGVDPTRPGSVDEARAVAQRHVEALLMILRRHPALAESEVAFISPWLGVREGRRVLGDTVLTREDCLSEARFVDAVAACAYDIDVHDPDGGDSRLERIPNSQYYHIPYRSLVAREHENLLLGSRCISGDFEAHSSYRVMSGVTAIGQAAGCAAALAAELGRQDVREIESSWIRHELDQHGQWTEGERVAPPAKT